MPNTDHQYENTRRIQYENGAQFVCVCSICGRYVKADDSIMTSQWDGSFKDKHNATCSKCGRTSMLFEGYF